MVRTTSVASVATAQVTSHRTSRSRSTGGGEGAEE
jgi:hypothetical protein